LVHPGKNSLAVAIVPGGADSLTGVEVVVALALAPEIGIAVTRDRRGLRVKSVYGMDSVDPVVRCGAEVVWILLDSRIVHIVSTGVF
jgi:hypothetical protein